MKNPINLKLSVSLLLLVLLTFCADDDPIQYQLETLCIPEETGTVTPLPGMYNEGTEIELKAIPIEEYVFKNWTGDVSGNDNPLKVIMLDDKNITAVFEKVNYTLNIELIGEGTVNQEIILAKSSSTDYESGTTVKLTAVPDDGWKFVEWSGDQTSTENPLQVTIESQMKIVANFEDKTQEKTYVPDDNFEKALIALGYDNVLDDYVNMANILTIEKLDISNKNISDMTGLQDFKSLISLDASDNNISSIDPFFGSSFGHGFAVGTLILNNNKLNSLDISSLHILGLLDVTNNPLNCIQMNNNQLSVIENGALIPMIVKTDEGVILSIDCSINNEQKTYIPDDGFEEALIEMSLDDTMDDYVKTINIINLENLDISSKNISDLEGLQDFKRLVYLNASNNNITSVPLDFGIKWGSYPPSPWAGNLNLSNNNLSDLNISQLNFFRTLDVRNNPLNCIEVNENQLLYFENAPENIKLMKGVNLSTDCRN